MKEIKFTFEDLKVYEKALDFIDTVYAVISDFPKEETYRLSSQFVRAATSIALNIAEGSGDTDAQFNRFLQIAGNSIRECVVCSKVAQRQDYITIERENMLRENWRNYRK